MALIRIFKTRNEAIWAKDVLEQGGIKAEVVEDKFNNVPIQKFGVRARFRVIVADEDFDKAVRFLMEKLPKKLKKS